jgi:hypothetical protein
MRVDAIGRSLLDYRSCRLLGQVCFRFVSFSLSLSSMQTKTSKNLPSTFYLFFVQPDDKMYADELVRVNLLSDLVCVLFLVADRYDEARPGFDVRPGDDAATVEQLRLAIDLQRRLQFFVDFSVPRGCFL